MTDCNDLVLFFFFPWLFVLVSFVGVSFAAVVVFSPVFGWFGVFLVVILVWLLVCFLFTLKNPQIK